MDLAEANKRPKETPVWRYLYSAKEAYQVKRAPGQSTFDCFSTSLRVWNLAPGQTLSSSSKPIPPCLSDSISSTTGLDSDDRWYINNRWLIAVSIKRGHLLHIVPQCQPCSTPLRPGLSTQDHMPSGLCKVFHYKKWGFFSVINWNSYKIHF